MTPDEAKSGAVQWLKDFAPLWFAIGGIVLGALGMSLCHCTPAIDPKDYPCHDPRMHWCQEGASCCWEWEACEGTPGSATNPPRCENLGFTGAARDSGAD